MIRKGILSNHDLYVKSRKFPRTDVSREIQILRKSQREMVGIKNSYKMKNAFDGLINILHTAEIKISETEDWSIEMLQTKMQKKIVQRQQNIQELWDNFKRCNVCIIGMSEEKKENGTEEIFELIMTESLQNSRYYQRSRKLKEQQAKQNKTAHPVISY